MSQRWLTQSLLCNVSTCGLSIFSSARTVPAALSGVRLLGGRVICCQSRAPSITCRHSQDKARIASQLALPRHRHGQPQVPRPDTAVSLRVLSCSAAATSSPQCADLTACPQEMHQHGPYADAASKTKQFLFRDTCLLTSTSSHP
jgi:hypothetical protein